MLSFSQRIGITPIKNIVQLESIDEDLKNALWNGLTIYYWKNLIKYDRITDNTHEVQVLLLSIWGSFFKKRLDEKPMYFEQLHQNIKQFFLKADWFEIYNFIEFVPNSYHSKGYDQVNEDFIEYCNIILERELSAYRFVNKLLTQISSKVEIEAIEEALANTDYLKPVKTHLNRALELYSDKKSPDYRNSIKESISAVESYCSIITGNPKATLGQALKQIEKAHNLHTALRSSFSSLYGYTSDANGIRHALLEEDKLNQEDAKFMLIACSAFINYLIQKESKTNQ
ncbi:AbiJ-NTD4 domain-containing protein [Adhaeribacter terreus]|uniref:AbiJ-NTD4 domain-containing protein n=1 Tax=Adhaeribacter terreus TaxID=529703 RepID=A0ABW0EA49_9BACT